MSLPLASARRQPEGATVPIALYSEIAAYYTRKVDEFGATPYGVDWTCIATQEMRFVQLLKLCDLTKAVSINDFGCGYGALLSYLEQRHERSNVDYCGVDLSSAMISSARGLWGRRDNVRFQTGRKSPRIADYTVASGIFNVRLGWDLIAWEAFVRRTLQEINRSSKLGFAVNFVRAHEGQIVREGLYATDPETWSKYCETQFGVRTEVLQDYGLREFTLLAHRR